MCISKRDCSGPAYRRSLARARARALATHNELRFVSVATKRVIWPECVSLHAARCAAADGPPN